MKAPDRIDDVLPHAYQVCSGDQCGEQQAEDHLLGALSGDPEQGVQQYEAEGGAQDPLDHQDAGAGRYDREPWDDGQRNSKNGRRALAAPEAQEHRPVVTGNHQGSGDKQCPVVGAHHRGATTANTPFAVSTSNTVRPIRAPTCW